MASRRGGCGGGARGGRAPSCGASPPLTGLRPAPCRPPWNTSEGFFIILATAGEGAVTPVQLGWRWSPDIKRPKATCNSGRRDALLPSLLHPELGERSCADMVVPVARTAFLPPRLSTAHSSQRPSFPSSPGRNFLTQSVQISNCRFVKPPAFQGKLL